MACAKILRVVPSIICLKIEQNLPISVEHGPIEADRGISPLSHILLMEIQ